MKNATIIDRTVMNRWLVIASIALLAALLTYVGPADQADALDREADMKIMRAQVASRSEHVTTPDSSVRVEQSLYKGQAEGSNPSRATSFPLTHPLSCNGIWIRKCADWQPCSEQCLEER